MTQIITIQGDHCWRCGKEFDKAEHKKTSHHGIPRTLRPKQNVSIPMCEKCHSEINKQDINTLEAYAHKIFKTTQNIPRAIRELITKLETLSKEGNVIKMEDKG